MPGQYVGIEDATGHRMTVSSAGAIPTYGAMDPSLLGTYVSSLVDAPGVVAANNYFSLFNPAASGRTVAIVQLIISSYIVSGGSNARESLLIYRTTAASGGTDVSPNIVKTNTSAPAPVAVARIGNPTLTLDKVIIGLAPPVALDSVVVNQGFGAASSGAFILNQGEGVGFRTNVGDTDQTWNITVIWGEI